MKILVFLIVFAATMAPMSAADFWAPSEGPRGGHVTDIIRMDDGTLFLGTFNTGVFRSKDDAVSWQSVNNGLPLYDITRLTKDSNGVLYAAVGDKGVYVSSNYGDSWTSLSSAIREKMVQTLFIDDDGAIYIALRGQGIYKSTDGGATWQLMGLKYKIIQTIEKFANGLFFAGGNDGIYRLDDDVWTYVSAAIPQEPVRTLAYDEINDTIYAGAYGLGVVRSRDNGDTWTYVNNGFADVSLGWIEELAIDEDNKIYASVSHWYYGGLYCTIDEGENWTEIDTDISHKNFQSLLVRENEILLGVYNYGLYHSIRPFEKWTPKINGFWFFTTSCLTFDKNANAYAGTPGAGLYRSQDGGKTWLERNKGTNQQSVYALDCTANDRLLMAVSFDGVYYSDSRGDDWTLQRSGLHNLSFNCLAHNSEFIFLGTHLGLYTLAADANRWELVQSVPASAHISALQAKDNTVCLGTNTGAIMISNDNGQSWMDISAGLPVQYISAIVLKKTNELYVAARTAGIYYSDDMGETWQDITFNLPTRVINVLLHCNNELYAGAETGVYRLTNKEWSWLNDGLYNTNVHDLQIDANGFLWAATDIGVARSAAKVTAVAADRQKIVPSSLKLFPVSPNPFNASTAIDFLLPQTAHATIDIFDLSGRLVETVLNRQLAAGYHKCVWEAGKNASGIYIVRLRADEEMHATMVTLQK